MCLALRARGSGFALAVCLWLGLRPRGTRYALAACLRTRVTRSWLRLCPCSLLAAQALPSQLALHARSLGFALAVCTRRSWFGLCRHGLRLALTACATRLRHALRARGLLAACTTRLRLGLRPRGLLAAQALSLQLMLRAWGLGFAPVARATRSRLAARGLLAAWALPSRLAPCAGGSGFAPMARATLLWLACGLRYALAARALPSQLACGLGFALTAGATRSEHGLRPCGSCLALAAEALPSWLTLHARGSAVTPLRVALCPCVSCYVLRLGLALWRREDVERSKEDGR